ncbi:MAG: hypothetical protein OHK0053_03120 [Microscillaceae bacterium]
MTEEIYLLSDAFTAEELENLLKVELLEQISLEIRKEAQGTLALDPTTLVAIMTISSTVLTTLITGFFGVWQKKIDNQAKNSENLAKLETAMVKIKLSGGGELEIPYTLAQDSQKLEEFVATIEGQQVKSVALITAP